MHQLASAAAQLSVDDYADPEEVTTRLGSALA